MHSKNEYQQVTKKVYVNSNCDQVKIVPGDNDAHYLILKLDGNFSVSVLSHSLPDNEKYFKPVGTIETYSATFISLLNQMEEFYAQMNTIDELTYVVDPDPEVITTKHNHRVIKLENRVYMKIKVDPLEPSAVTTIFYGPTKMVERYRNIYRDKIDEWSANDDIYRNFLRIFGKKRFVSYFYRSTSNQLLTTTTFLE